MMFGGSVASMRTSLKNNKRDNITIFHDSKSPQQKVSYRAKHKKKTKEEILQIEQKVQRLKRLERIKFITVCSLMLIIILSVWAFL